MADKLAPFGQEKKKKERYISQDGFVKVPIYRGFTEISKLYQLTSKYNAMILGGYVR